MCQIVVFPSALNPHERNLFAARDGQTINEWLDESGYAIELREKPIVVHLNGVEIVESDYGHVLLNSDHVMLIALPEWQAVGAWIVKNWILIAYAVSAIYVASIEPALPAAADTAEGSPTYTVSARGNRARLGQPKPVLYGTMRTYPDLASTAYSEYDANDDQYLFQIFEVTMGTAVVDMSTARFEDTPLSNFTDVEYNVILPGENPELYPGDVITSSEVNGIDINNDVVGDYVVNPVATEITQIGFDFVAPAGIFEQSKTDGELKHHSTEFMLEVQLIDDNDQALGVWSVLDNITVQGASRDAIRRTYRYPVARGRYQARVSRVGLASDVIRISDNVRWSQLKGYVADDIGLTDSTRVELVIRASNQLGNKSLSKFNVVSSRRLQIWNETTGWSNNMLTNNPVWAYCDVCRQYYGGKRADAFINLNELKLLADQYDADGIEFNGVFDTKGDVWAALEHIATASFATHFDEMGVYTLVRDTHQAQAVAAFTMRNIVRGSLKIDDAGVLEETANAVRVWFYDRSKDYRHVSMLCAIDGSAADNIREVELFGVTDSSHAHKLGMYLAAQNRYRRRYVEWETGIEGRLLRYGDKVKVSHFLLGEIGADQISGDVVDFNGVDELTLNEIIPDFVDPWIYLRAKNGEPLGPFSVRKTGQNRIRVVESFPVSELSFEAGYERTHVAIGEGDSFLVDVKITNAEASGDLQVKLRGFVDNTAVYSIADGVPVPPVTNLPTALDIGPRVTDLFADIRGTTDAPEVHLTWSGENADKYFIHISLDSGVTFSPAGQGVSYEPRFTYRPPPGNVIFRVAGVNLFLGEWVSILVDTSQAGYTAPLPPTNLQLRSSFVGPVCELQWAGEYGSYTIEFIDNNNANTFTAQVTGEQYDFSYVSARSAGIGRSFTVRVRSVGSNGLLSDTAATLSVSNPAPPVLNNISINIFTSRASINFDWPVDSDISGISVWLSVVSGFSPSASNIVIDQSRDPVLSVPIDSDVDTFVIIAAVDVWGESNLNYSGQYTVSGASFFDQMQTLDLSNPLASFGSIGQTVASLSDDIQALSDAQGGDFSLLNQQISDLDVAVNNNTSSINQTNQAYVDADNALSQQINDMSSTVGGNTTSISTVTQTVNGLGALRSVSINSNGYVTGYALASELVSGGIVSTMAFHVDNFYVGKEGYLSVPVFAIDTVTNRVGIDGGLVVTGSIVAESLDVNELSAISANLGTVNAGLFRTTAVADAARVEVGSSSQFPFWIGVGAEKNTANALVYYDSVNNAFVVKEHGASGAVLFSTSSGIDFSGIDFAALGIRDMAFIDRLTSSNSTTFVDSAAILDAMIANLDVSKITGALADFVAGNFENVTVTNANMGSAAVDTINVAGNAISAMVGSYSAGLLQLTESAVAYTVLQSAAVTNPDSLNVSPVIVCAAAHFSLTYNNHGHDVDVDAVEWRVRKGASVVASGIMDDDAVFLGSFIIPIRTTLAANETATFYLEARYDEGDANRNVGATQRSLTISSAAR